MSFDEQVLCPFCAYIGKIIDFRLPLESGGYSIKRYRCPDCGQVMRKNTLTKHVTLEEWAYWLYSSIRVWDNIFAKDKHKDGFYQRISWDKLLYRLKKYGYAERFWDAWKEVKKLKESEWVEIVERTFIEDMKQSKLV